MRFIALTVGLLLSWSIAAGGAELEGGWGGEWIKGGDALPVTVTFVKTAEGYSGTFDSDALQVAGIPLSEISQAEGAIHWLLKGDRTTVVFDGRMNGDAMSGTLTEGATTGTFKLDRAVLPAAKVVSRDVTFAHGDVTLAGTLLLPVAPGRHAAVLFLQGSGPEGRWANRYLAQMFARNGIVALIYDKRGVGQSTGHWESAGFDALAEDAMAGVAFLRTQAEVDPARVGIYGHSQGGTIAPIVAARDGRLGFIIASAAAGLATADVETYSVENSIGLARLPEAQKKDARSYVRALVDVAYRRGPRARLDALAAKFKGRSWYFDPPPEEHSYWAISRAIADFDPAHWWQQVHAPVFLVYGAHDERVPPAASAQAISAALKAGGNQRVTVKFYANADHTFTIVDRTAGQGWPLHVPDYADTLVAWVHKQP